MKKTHPQRDKDINIFLFISILFPILIILSLAWYFLVDGILFYCTDKMPVLDLIPPFVHGINTGDYYIASPIIVYIAWIITLVSIFTLPWILLKNAYIYKLSNLKIFLISVSIPILLFIAMFAYGMSISTSVPPSPPPNWDSPSAVYMIGKKHQNYVVHYEIDGNVGDYFVGISKIDLAPFMERKVIIKGNFPKNYSELMERATDTQCIKGVCHPIFNPKFWEEHNQNTPVIDIDDINIIGENHAIEIINNFSNNWVDGLLLEGRQVNLYDNHTIENYVDKHGVKYSLDLKDNEIIYYNALSTNLYFDTHKSKIPIEEARKIGINALNNYYKQFNAFSEGATFEQNDGVGTKIDVYSFDWQKKLNGLPYHVVINVDKFGNVVLYQREYISELINSH